MAYYLKTSIKAFDFSRKKINNKPYVIQSNAIDKKVKAEIVLLYNQKISLAKIGMKLKISQRTVKKNIVKVSWEKEKWSDPKDVLGRKKIKTNEVGVL